MLTRSGLSLFVVLLGAPLADEVSFHAAEGTEVVRTFDYEARLELEEMSFTVDGNDHAAGRPEMAVDTERTIVVADVYGAPDSSHPLRLTRTFQALEGLEERSVQSPGGDPQSSGGPLSSELEGRRVVFEWDADEEQLTPTFDDAGDEDEDLLEPLREDMDLRAFLPPGEVDEGDSWDVDLDAFWYVRFPGGIDLEDESGREEGELDFEQLIRENTDGDLTATYGGTRDEDGRRVAVIELEVELESSADRTIDRDDSEVDQTIGEGFELEGELLWDLEAGLLHSLELDGTITVSSVETSLVSMGGDQEFEVVKSTILAGEVHVELSVEIQ